MSEHLDSQESISKSSTSQSSFVEDLNATQEKSHPSPLQRLKKQWKEIKRSGDLSWRPKRTYMTSTLSHRVVILDKDSLTMKCTRLSIFVKTAKGGTFLQPSERHS
ncbi:uncharacterized protein N7487_004844 [Penicillium crustosum]|uniref:uncharacterized protein n=1 Tax=Penicillium crustosum TaxID=36656 RepID=UPI0023A42CFA|nr:uncharacterized protein N7487_004844 [Penicillium crustosum]KAJ5410485.1 hypothetical protein N7487_004844 [Penicillium crustosum]